MHSIPDGKIKRAALAGVGPFLLPLLFLVGVFGGSALAARPAVEVVQEPSGSRLTVDGEDFMVFGMNWGYMPIGQNYTYSLWTKPDDIIEAALAREMPLLKAMGLNTIRHYVGMPPRWVKYVYETYGIYTVINHVVGRYGMTLNGIWHPVTDYSDPEVREALKAEVRAMVAEFEGTPGLLMWLLGNENNYGLSWSSFEIEALPEGERNATRARYLYSLFGEIIQEMKQLDPERPVAMANGDLQYIDIIAEECKGLDVFGSNVYRGISARDFFQVVDDKLGIPTFFTEFGSDAFNAVTMEEDQRMQARYLLGQWEEIYEQSAGKGRVGNAIGGLIFQWSDGWWKFRQEERLDIHDTNASWPNGGYPDDFREGENNMNEEWWGITAKGYPNAQGLYEVYPRAAYYALQEAFQLDPYAAGTDLPTIRAHFAKISPEKTELAARGDAARMQTETLSKLRLSGFRMEWETFSTGGARVSTPDNDEPQSAMPSFLGFDHGESFFATFEAKPSEAILGQFSVNVLGNVPRNPMDEIFYEARGRPENLSQPDGSVLEATSLERVKVYRASFSWDDRYFMLDGFYRTGHLHWQYEGDFFGLYRDAFYGENIDIYNGEAPIGVELQGKKLFDGAKLAFGPELWWGANPALFLKYQRAFEGIQWTGLYQEDFAQRSAATSSIAIPVRSTRKASLQAQKSIGNVGIEAGVLWSGQPREGESFQLVDDDLLEDGATITPTDIREDTVRTEDTFGFKAKAIWQSGRWNVYGEGAYMGLVADAGPTAIPTFTGWSLKDSGSGNQVNALGGAAVGFGNWQIGPNFLWQKPIVGPMPHADDLQFTQGRPRNVLSDPFAVLYNRETTAAELMLSYDRTPATWMWAWDNNMREDADLAASIGLVFRRHHTTADALLFVSEDQSLYAFPGSTPARDWGELWEINSRIANRLGRNARMISSLVFGTAEPNGDDSRLVTRFGASSRVVWPSVAVEAYARFNDYGPYDYHRDHNLTYPLQLMGDISFTLGNPVWFNLPQTRYGVRATYRTLDHRSPRYMPEGMEPLLEGEEYPAGLEHGREWEIRTYVHLAL